MKKLRGNLNDPAPLSMGFPGHEYWSGLPLPSPGDVSDPGIKPVSCISCIAGVFFNHRATWEAHKKLLEVLND